jgi:HD-GYP domain-containing protein (c-di-GMP phosphodiesterase class II)
MSPTPTMQPRTRSTRLADLVASLSLAIDLGTGQPLEHTLRTCLLSMELARRSGVGADRLDEVHLVALLRYVGCTAAAADTAATVGDDLAYLSGMGPAFMGTGREHLRAVLRSSGTGDRRTLRARHRMAALVDRSGARRAVAAHCEASRYLAARLGAPLEVVDALGHAFERWDGHGIPGTLEREAIPPAIRVVTVARDIDLWLRVGGEAAATAVVHSRAGRGYDPTVAAAFLVAPAEVVAAAAAPDVWTAALEAEPEPHRRVDPDGLDDVLEVFADFADLKSPWLRGHSPGVATLAGAAARAAGLDEVTARRLRRAGLVHDLGRVAVANSVWDHPGKLSEAQEALVHEHPGHAERILRRSPVLKPYARLAAHHHERADGSGYPRGVRRREPSLEESLLAAADTFHALTEPRPHRPALAPARAGEHLVREVAAGRLPREAVDAVLAAAGRATLSRRHAVTPAGLTHREVEVLRMIVRGASTREMIATLGLTGKVVADCVEDIYDKLGVTTRAGAALFAMQHGLLA